MAWRSLAIAVGIFTVGLMGASGELAPTDPHKKFLMPFGMIIPVTSIDARYRHEQAAILREAEFIRFKTYGDPSKPPVVIVPGLDGVTAFFADVVPELTPHYHVVLFNLPLAAPPLSRAARAAEPYTFSYIARKLAAVMDEAGIKGKAAIIGESFGGMVAQRLTLDFPEKVSRLVVLSSLAKTELTPIVKFKAGYILPVVESIGYLFPFVAQTLFALAHSSDVVETHEPLWAKRLFVKEASWADHWSVMARCKVAINFNVESELHKIKTGALVMYGKDDTFTASGTQQLLNGIAGSREHGLPGGHLCHMTSPKAFSSAVLEYISSTASS